MFSPNFFNEQNGQDEQKITTDFHGRTQRERCMFMVKGLGYMVKGLGYKGKVKICIGGLLYFCNSLS